MDDFNRDLVPDILTLDRSLLLGLTLLNVEQELVAVHPAALTVECGRAIPGDRDRAGPARPLAGGFRGRGNGWHPLAISGQALLGDMDFDRGTWILTVDSRRRWTARERRFCG